MCNSISNQLYRQRNTVFGGTVTKQQVSVPTVTSTPTDTVATQTTATKTTRQRKSRVVTRYREVTQRVKRCNNGRCWYENVTTMQPYQATEYYYVEVPVVTKPKEEPKKEEPKVELEKKEAAYSPLKGIEDKLTVTEYVPTPTKELMQLFKEVYIPSDAIFYDIGCGEGDTLQYFHAQYALKNSYGIELSHDFAQKARLNNPSSQILVGDARDYTYLNATHVFMYLYPELMSEVIPLLPKNTTIISYSHELPEALSPRKVGNFFIATK